MTWLYILNYYVLQWFFIRLAKVENADGKTIAWCILKVWPLSGYGSRPYRFWGRKRAE